MSPDASTVGFVNLLPGLLVAGAGLGLVVAPMFDIILASVTDKETGSASGVPERRPAAGHLHRCRRVGENILRPVLGGGFHTALSRCLWVEVIAMIGLLVLSPLVPRRAREQVNEFEGPPVLGSVFGASPT